MDSNHRSALPGQIYSLLPSTTRPPVQRLTANRDPGAAGGRLLANADLPVNGSM